MTAISRIESNDKISIALKTYSDMVYRICFIYLHTEADMDDAFQEVFLKLFQKEISFKSKEHEKAWIIRVTINQCKDMLKSSWRKKVTLVENVESQLEDTAENELLQIVLSLPQKYKDVIYLYYYEGYTVPELAELLKQKENTIYSHLHRAKKLLKQKLEVKEYEYSF